MKDYKPEIHNEEERMNFLCRIREVILSAPLPCRVDIYPIDEKPEAPPPAIEINESQCSDDYASREIDPIREQDEANNDDAFRHVEQMQQHHRV